MRKLLFAVMCLLIMGLFAVTDISLNQAAAGTSGVMKGADLVATDGTSQIMAPTNGVITSLQFYPYDPTHALATLLATEAITIIVETSPTGRFWKQAGTFTDACVGSGTVALGAAATNDTIMHIDLGGVKYVKLTATYCLADSIAVSPWYTYITTN